MAYVFVALGLLMLVLAVWLWRQPGRFEVERELLIAAPVSHVFPLLQDFKYWPRWSPWLMHEPEARLDFAPVTDMEGSWYRWDGKLIGAGTISHSKIIPHSEITQKLEFVRPFKASNDVLFRFLPQGDTTRLIWRMRGEMPFLLRWMGKKMDAMVGKDFSIGLARIATLAAPQADPLQIEFKGRVQAPWQHYVYTRYEGSVSALPAHLEREFARLTALAAAEKVTLDAPAFTLYRRFEPDKDHVACDVCLPLLAGQTLRGCEEAILGTACYFRTELRGGYAHLPLAWHAALGQLKMRKLKLKKKAPIIERYITVPRTSGGLERLTYFDLPIQLDWKRNGQD